MPNNSPSPDPPEGRPWLDLVTVRRDAAAVRLAVDGRRYSFAGVDCVWIGAVRARCSLKRLAMANYLLAAADESADLDLQGRDGQGDVA